MAWHHLRRAWWSEMVDRAIAWRPPIKVERCVIQITRAGRVLRRHCPQLVALFKDRKRSALEEPIFSQLIPGDVDYSSSMLTVDKLSGYVHRRFRKSVSSFQFQKTPNAWQYTIIDAQIYCQTELQVSSLDRCNSRHSQAPGPLTQ